MNELAFAFLGEKLIAQGGLDEVKIKIQNLVDKQNILLFDQLNGRQIHIDFSGEVSSKTTTEKPESHPEKEASPKSKRGRPKLGVVGREITLLPRHWQWLDSQRGGASATLRRLVDEHRSANESKDRIRSAQDSTNRFIYAVAGNLSNFEEAVRAIYSRNELGFGESIAGWPADIRKCADHFATAIWVN